MTGKTSWRKFLPKRITKLYKINVICVYKKGYYRTFFLQVSSEKRSAVQLIDVHHVQDKFCGKIVLLWHKDDTNGWYVATISENFQVLETKTNAWMLSLSVIKKPLFSWWISGFQSVLTYSGGNKITHLWTWILHLLHKKVFLIWSKTINLKTCLVEFTKTSKRKRFHGLNLSQHCFPYHF